MMRINVYILYMYSLEMVEWLHVSDRCKKNTSNSYNDKNPQPQYLFIE